VGGGWPAHTFYDTLRAALVQLCPAAGAWPRAATGPEATAVSVARARRPAPKAGFGG